MTLPWWGWIAFAGMILAGVGVLVAPFIGAWWARDFRPRNCERCGRELVGSPPQHLLADRAHCAWIADSQGDRLDTVPRTSEAAYWSWVRGRRSP